MASVVAAASTTALAGTSETAVDMRLALGALLQVGGDPRQSISGVRGDAANSAALRVHTDNPRMGVDVMQGQCFVQGEGLLDGVWVVTFSHTSLDVAVADAANDRLDLVIVHVLDTGDASAVGQLEVVTGVAGGAAPDLVALGFHDYLTLAQVRVRAGTTSIAAADITDLRTFTVALGGTPPGGSAAPSWQSYSPSWSSNGSTKPTLGNGSIYGEFLAQDDSICQFSVAITWGSTTRKGNGSLFNIGLPKAARRASAFPAYLSWGLVTMIGQVADGGTTALVTAPGLSTMSEPGAGQTLTLSGSYRYQ